MRSRTLLLAGLFGFIALRAATLTAANGESVAAEFGASHLRISGTGGHIWPLPYLLWRGGRERLDSTTGDLSNCPAFPGHIEAKVARSGPERPLDRWDGCQVVTLMPAPQLGIRRRVYQRVPKGRQFRPEFGRGLSARFLTAPRRLCPSSFPYLWPEHPQRHPAGTREDDPQCGVRHRGVESARSGCHRRRPGAHAGLEDAA